MKVSLEWLREYVDFDVEPGELARMLTMSGTAVDTMFTFGAGVSGVLVCEVLEVGPHPDADTLRLAVVSDGTGTRPIVCGAPNLAEGMKAALALPGATLPTVSEGKLEAVTIRGVRSEGMMVSGLELGISEDHSGILELDAAASVGMDLHEVLPLDDVIFELEVTPNRPDCMSMLGVAREVAALTGGTLRRPALDVDETGGPVFELAKVFIEDPSGCPRYTARVVTEVGIGPSPGWMARRLLASGLRPINNVVDITNYVLMETGQPLHAFDLDLLGERTIVVRRARPGEKMTTLDGAERPLGQSALVIADAREPVALAGIMGGEDSEVTEHSRNILIESAFFDPTGIMLTSRKLGLRTEASARFERGCDPEGTAVAALRAAVLMAGLAGGKVAEGDIDVYPREFTPVTVEVRPERVNRVLGTEIPASEMAQILGRLEIRVEEGETLKATPPSFRPDLEREIDMIEEIARIYGYDRIPAGLPAGAGADAGLSRRQLLASRIADSLVSLGLSEVYLYSFMRRADLDLLRVGDGDRMRRVVALLNPLAETGEVMRTTLLPGLLRAAAGNFNRGNRDLALFETGRVFISRSVEETPEEIDSLGVLLYGALGPPSWSEPARPADFFDLKGSLESLAGAIGVELGFEPAEITFLAPGRSSRVLLAGDDVGVAGQLHPAVSTAFGLEGDVFVAELEIAPLLDAAPEVRQFIPVGRYPNVKVDIAVVVDEDLAADQVERRILSSGGVLLRSVRLFDLYTGPQVPPGRKSLAYALEFGSAEGTLTDEQAHAEMGRIVAALEEQFGAVLRGGGNRGG
ncbi:MAG: phenylalanine--tRNA ligase subunit beta [Actinobacteria bacterium]|nr:phenylalanine--tRNA ligase subunit beta [Actinomycetota bacterium]MBU1943874.1 phenylalanine--tRNA ligase subunit beta [Actinomycetota bacterium]MBU2688604.1 phenylalanine--tRNA ligase subunit beta [Actinomycetota bacterium]